MSSTSSAGTTAAAPPAIDQEMLRRIADQFAGRFNGDFIGPDDADYGDARSVWNAMIAKRPGVILRCTSTEDVVAAVDVAHANGLPPSIRCGGHSVSGKALSDGGLTIDLSGMRAVTVDPERMLVHAGGGCLLGDGTANGLAARCEAVHAARVDRCITTKDRGAITLAGVRGVAIADLIRRLGADSQREAAVSALFLPNVGSLN